MVNESVAKALTVEFAGRPLPPALANTLVEAYVDDSRTLPDLFVLRFRDPSRTLLAQAGVAIGTEARLLASADGGPAPEPLLTGSVTALEVEIDETGTFTIVRGLDDSHRLFRGRTVASYQNMTLTDICVQVARRAGLKPGRMDVAGPVLEHVAQPNVSDWEFLRGLTAEAGAQLYVVDGELHVARPTGAGAAPDPSARARQDPLVLEMGDNLLRCRAGVSAAEQVSAVEVRGWDVRAKQPLVGRAQADRAATLDVGTTPAEVAGAFGAAALAVTDAPYGSQAEVDQAAESLAARIAGAFAELEAVVRGNPSVRAGGAVTLAGVGAPFEGRYTVTSSRHVFDPVRGYETWLTVSGQQERSLFGLTGGGTGNGGHGTGGGRCAGLANGTVTDTKDPEGLGRVKVRFPWLSDEYASDWARTAQASGTGGGEAFIPEVGDEVLVGFEQGHLDRPYVLAGLFNGQDKPAAGGAAGGEAVDPTSGAVNRRALASKGGNKVELLDAAGGAQGVRLLTGDGKLTINLDRTATEIVVSSDGTVRIEAARQVSVSGEGVVLDAGGGTLELTGNAVRLTARGGVEVNGGNGALTLASGGVVEVRGNQVTVNGATRTELRGGSALTVNAPLVHIN
ncbi:VgrG-related protein [Streptomyces millisiae]|uniref:VgrG-related protein n=1 Tax=Streptomyces millisiae TaxID=3075542 RepID=A0ABU2LP45_9ACTN|nr:VgrG-related protein [Streptomyces sp. DSM 44918]MDT0319369.1 VgrG-related protein [Streptomyces sp. DSM 44918]